MLLLDHWKEILIGATMALSGPITGKALSYAAEPVKHVEPAKYGTISKTEVFWMYTMKTRFWPDGQKVTVVYQDFTAKGHVDFCIEVLGVTTDRFEKNVSTYINKGNAAYFVKADNERQVVNIVSTTPGSIGYLSSEFVVVNRAGQVEKLRIVG